MKPAKLIIPFFLLLLSFLLLQCESKSRLPDKEILVWETTGWTLENPGVEGNPFDIEAGVRFTHEDGQTVNTHMFYDGNDSWIIRFTATKAGTWSFTTSSEEPGLNGYSGSVTVNPNPDPEANGFITSFGNKWGWQGSEKVFVPQWVMGKDMDYFYDLENDVVRVDRIEEEIREFMTEHGFSGFHLRLNKRMFDITGGEGPFDNPDPRTYRALETFLKMVHEAGGSCHIWMWGSDGPHNKMDGEGPRGILGAPGNEKDLRNLRYFASRLGPIPGWTLGHGVDTENGTAVPDQLDHWKGYIEEHLGWDHFIGARVGYDEKGLWAYIPKGPRPEHDENYCSEIKDEHCSWLGGDYIGYTSYRPLYDRYLEALNHQPDKPSFEEDRFRLRNLDRWTYKDYNQELTRRGLWHSTLAGGVANIWGHLLPNSLHGGSRTYDEGTVHIKHQIKTYSRFFENRFLKEMETFKMEDPVVLGLKTPDMSKLVFYQEQTDMVSLDLEGLSGPLPAIAVDTHTEYEEIPIGNLDAGTTGWKAPYKSDWAIAIGEF